MRLCLVFGMLFLAACAAQPIGLLRPNGVAVAPDGTLYVMDFGHYRIAHVSASGTLLSEMGGFGAGPAQLLYGWDIALDANQNAYVCNQVKNDNGLQHESVKVFATDGRFVREIGSQDYTEDDGLPRDYCYGLEVDQRDWVYMTAYGGNRVKVFDAEGQLHATWFGEIGTADGQFNGLNDIAVDDQRQLVYVTDAQNSRVQQFDLIETAAGLTVTHRLSFGSYGRAPGEFAYLQNIAVDDTTGSIYVGDVANRRVQIFDATGRFLRLIVAPGVPDWQVMGLTVDASGRLYVADALNHVVWVFNSGGAVEKRIELTP